MKVVSAIGILVFCLVSESLAQTPDSSIDLRNLRQHVFALSDDSTLGRASGTEGIGIATAYIATAFRAVGLEPAGDSGTYCQHVPLGRISTDSLSYLETPNERMIVGSDFLLIGVSRTGIWETSELLPVFGGFVDDRSSWISEADIEEKLAVFLASKSNPSRPVNPAILISSGLFSNAAALGVAGLDAISQSAIRSLTEGRQLVLPPEPSEIDRGSEAPRFLFSSEAIEQLFEADLNNLLPGAIGLPLFGLVSTSFATTPYNSCNVVGVLPGADPSLAGQYVALSAHYDHLGTSPRPLDHDSILAFNKVVRPLGSFSRRRRPTPEEIDRITNAVDSIRTLRPPRSDNVFNGANDNASGVAALIEIARSFATSNNQPSRSILFVSHAAEEIGLLGSTWFTTNPTVDVDSIVAEIEIDMVGHAGSAWSFDGEPQLLAIGARLMSDELGDLIDSVSRGYSDSFRVITSLEDQAIGNRIFCLADHYSYARLGIPSIAFTSGPNVHYHQVTDEAHYLDFSHMATISMLVRDLVITISHRDRRLSMIESLPDFETMCGR